MKPSLFDYKSPRNLQEALQLLEHHGDEAKIIAGGQSLVPMMNFRLARPEVLIDINGVTELEYIREEGDTITIGALTRERDIMSSPIITEQCPILAEAISHIGHAPIRTRGTIGGSLTHADPAGEIPTTARALDAQIKIIGPSGERVVTTDEFFITYLITTLEPTEMLVEIAIPALPPNSGWSFLELSRRRGDFAIVAVACILFLDVNNQCSGARIALGGVAPTPIRAEQAEELLSGRVITDELIEEAGHVAVESVDPESDYHASAEYRAEMAKVFVKRAIREALSKGKGGR